VLNI
jgi:hypothetical protein